MKINRNYKQYDPKANFLLPPSMRDWLPKNHLIWFLVDFLDSIDLSAFEKEMTSSKGRLAYHPKLILTLLLYGYCIGCTSSRKIEQKTYENIAFRIAAGNYHPDHDTICRFRKRNLKAFQSLFTDILKTACKMDLVSIGSVSLDGTKIKANASKHKAMSYDRMQTKEIELEEIVKELLKKAEQTDKEEDKLYGKGSNLHTLPDEIKYQEKRLETIKKARKALEEEALQEQALKKQEIEQKELQKKESTNTDQKTSSSSTSKTNSAIDSLKNKDNPREENKTKSKKSKGCNKRKKSRNTRCSDVNPTKSSPGIPSPKKQRNFTDPESRILMDSAHKTFIQGYNAQIVVEEKHQFIVASDITQETNDKKQVKPMMEELLKQLDEKPQKLLADAGYFSENNISYLKEKGIDPYVAPGRLKKQTDVDSKKKNKKTNTTTKTKVNEQTKKQTEQELMRTKLKTPEGDSIYRRRKGMVEPVFGWIKSCRNISQFRLRGLKSVKGEWQLITLTHNLDRIYRILKKNVSSSYSFSDALQSGLTG